MKKILWFTADYFIDVDRQLVPYLRNNYNLDIRWVVIQSLNGSVVPKNLDYEILYLHYRGKDLRTYFEIKKFLNQIKLQNFDLVYSDSLGMMYYLALFRNINKVPLIHAAHNVNPYPHVWTLGLKIEVKFIFNKCRYFQMFSRHTAKWFAEHYPQKSFFYAPMVVKDFGQIRTNNYNVDASKVNLLFFGNIIGNKRLDLLIDAVKELPENIQSKIHLNICGNCKMDKEQFIRQIGDCKCISPYFKRISDEEIPELFIKHQYLVLPYENVAQSGPHMIAYNYNLPVIASDIDGFAERIENGVNGFLFKKNDKGSLKAVIMNVINLNDYNYSSLKKNLSDFVSCNYSLKAVASKYIEYFDKLWQ